jgi:5'-nucleotidase
MLSSRVLLDLEEADKIYAEEGLEAYKEYMLPSEDSPDYDPEVGGRRMAKGPLFDFAIAALKLNEVSGKPIVEIGLSCKDETDTAVPIFRSMDVAGLIDMNYRIAKSGSSVDIKDHEAFGTDLFLTRNSDDAQLAIDNGIAAASIYTQPEGFNYSREKDAPITIYVDGDAVAFGSSSEVRYRKEGLEVYREMESEDFDKNIEPGPFTEVLAKISQLNAEFPRENQPFKIALLTARGSVAGARALTVANDHGIDFNGGTYFMGGAEKAAVLKAHRPDMYFDDQMVHLKDSAEFCPTGLVAYENGSPMHTFQLEQELDAANSNNAKKSVKPSSKKNSPSPK